MLLLGALLHQRQMARALDNGLAQTPPMGWISWTRFTCETNCSQYPSGCINSALYKSMAHQMVTGGYLAAGYNYVNVDDCWSEMERDGSTGRLVADRERFPEGLGGLAWYIHNLGLKFGTYGDCGTQTCAGYPAQLRPDSSNDEDNNFQLDAQTFADWQVDSFKFDGCNIDPMRADQVCPKMAVALNQTGRQVLLVCEWPFYQWVAGGEPDFSVAADNCNAWRYWHDVEDSWISVLAIIDFTVSKQARIGYHHGPGAWFDPDMLVIGNSGLSLDQARAQMAIWCLWSAPLYMSNDLRSIEPEMAAILKNKALIEVDQDQMGVFGQMVAQTEEARQEAFVKPVHPIINGCPSFVIVYLNRDTLGDTKRVSFGLRDLLSSAPIEVAAQRYNQAGHHPGGEFSSAKCHSRLINAMTKDPNMANLVVRPMDGRPREEFSIVEYEVVDLFANSKLFNLALNSTLELHVNPSGVRAVGLSEPSDRFPNPFLQN